MRKLPVILSLAVMGMVSTASFADSLPEVTVEGLERVQGTKDIAMVWADPAADLSQYGRVHILEPLVAFKKNWQREQNRGLVKVRKSDMERIKKDVGDLFMEVFTEELEKGGYSLTDERAADVLVVRPAIINLDVNAPDIRSSYNSQTYTSRAGSMTLYLELYDAETDDLLAKALDPKTDRDRGYMQWQTGPANRMAGLRMMRPWAQALREGLDEARSATHSD